MNNKYQFKFKFGNNKSWQNLSKKEIKKKIDNEYDYYGRNLSKKPKEEYQKRKDIHSNEVFKYASSDYGYVETSSFAIRKKR